MSLLESQATYKPFRYPWAFEAWRKQQQLHWLPEEVPMAEDVRHWKLKLTDRERHLLTQIFRFFTQADVEVNNCYMHNYSRVFQPTEIQMMLAAFSNMETIHIAAYSHLLDTIGMPETEYQVFLSYKEMKDKYDYMQKWGVDTKEDIAKTLAVFGAFTEGVQLFASFAILMNFPRFNKMTGMGQIITFSIRDETLHFMSIIRLFHVFMSENPEIKTPKLIEEIRGACREIVAMEDAFIDLCFETGPIDGLSPEEVKAYIRYIANSRCEQLHIPTVFEATENPLPWMDSVTRTEFVNFFENRVTEYSRAATRGSWEEVFSDALSIEGENSSDAA